MHTSLQLRIQVNDDAVIGETNLIIWRGDDTKMLESIRLDTSVNILPTLQESGSYQQWAVTCLRDVTDRIIAGLLEEIAAGTEKPMLKHQYYK